MTTQRIKKEWIKYMTIYYPKGVSKEQEHQIKHHFYAGCWAVSNQMVTAIDLNDLRDYNLTPVDFVARAECIHDEIKSEICQFIEDFEKQEKGKEK